MSGTSIAKVRVLLLADNTGLADRLYELLQGEDMDLNLAAREMDQALQQVRSVVPDVILVGTAGSGLIENLERIDAVSGGSPIIALLTPEQTKSSRDVLLAGARAYLPTDPSRDDLVDTITTVLERERRRRTMLARQLGVEVDLGQVIAVHGSKGGVGATSVATNLAVSVKEATHRRVALVDANLYSGDVAASLNLMSRTSLADLTPHLKELDEEFLGRASVRHVSGVRVFLAPDDFVRAQSINGEQISRILKVMRQYFDYIIVDTCSLPDQVTSSALEEANQILLVTTPEVPAVKNAARFYRLADEFGYRNKIRLVLNRAKSRGALSLQDIQEHLHTPVSTSISSDGRTVTAAINAGEPVIFSRWSKFGTGIWRLTAMLTGVSARSSDSRRSHTEPAEDSSDVSPTSVPTLNLASETAGPTNPVARSSGDGQTRTNLLNKIRSLR